MSHFKSLPVVTNELFVGFDESNNSGNGRTIFVATFSAFPRDREYGVFSKRNDNGHLPRDFMRPEDLGRYWTLTSRPREDGNVPDFSDVASDLLLPVLGWRLEPKSLLLCCDGKVPKRVCAVMEENLISQLPGLSLKIEPYPKRYRRESRFGPYSQPCIVQAAHQIAHAAYLGKLDVKKLRRRVV